MRYAVVDAQSKVVNIIEWDGATAWSPPAGHTVRLAAKGDILPAPAPSVTLESVLIAKGVITKADLDAVTASQAAVVLPA